MAFPAGWVEGQMICLDDLDMTDFELNLQNDRDTPYQAEF